MTKEEIIIGRKVVYYSTIDNNKKTDPFCTQIDSLPWKVSGEWVCRIKNKNGCVAISHLQNNEDSKLVIDIFSDNYGTRKE